MSRFNNYARTLDETAKAIFKEYHEAEASYKEAESREKEYSKYRNSVNPEYIAKAARAHADFVEAKDRFFGIKRAFADSTGTFNDLRKELAAAINDTYAADPTHLDSNTLELLKSGILNSSEYSRLLNKAKAADNPTMVRLIGKYADDAAKGMSDKYGATDTEARALRAVVHESKTYTGSDRLEAFDTMVNVFNRCAKNPAMIKEWDNLLGETIEKF